MNVTKKSIQLTSAMIGLGIDRALLAAGLGVSRRKIRQILDQGGVTVNSRVERFASYKVKRGDRIEVQYVAENLGTEKQPQFNFSARDILYDQHHIIAINKPPLLASQATRSPKVPHALSVLQAYREKSGKKEKLVLCHRLDKETSGVLLIASNEEAATALMAQFKSRKVAKTYLALCYGIPSKEEWQVKCYLSKLHPKTGLVHKVNSGGNLAETKFKTLAVNPRLKLSLLACYPHSGRTHQIRVHLQLSGLPIVGDKKYATSKPSLPSALQELTLSHHFLHALQISFNLPPEGNKLVRIAAPLPATMELFCRKSNLTLAKEAQCATKPNSSQPSAISK
jgi:RluA family pseudouridine synthase